MELWFSEHHTPDVKLSLRVNKQLYSAKSDYQRIDVFDTKEFGRVLSLDGNIMLTERDEFIYDEMITHVPLAVHPNVKKVLVIGAGDGGVVHHQWHRTRRQLHNAIMIFITRYGDILQPNSPIFEIKTKALYDKLPVAFAMMEEIVFYSIVL